MVTYADPKAGFATLTTINNQIASFRFILGCNDATARMRICCMAAMMAPTYIAGTSGESLRYYLTQNHSPEVTEEALEALAWQSLYGDNGSYAQRQASHAMRWESEP